MKVSETCFYAVQVLESVGVSRVHQEAWARSFQVIELLRYLHRNKLDKKIYIYMLSPAVFQIRVMITSFEFRYIVTSLTSTPPPLHKSPNIHPYPG